MKKYNDAVLDFVQDCYYEDALKDVPQPMTLADSVYNLACLTEDEYTDVPKELTAEDFMAIWNELVANHGTIPACESAAEDVQCDHHNKEEKNMKKSEAIETYRAVLESTMVDCYRSVLESDGGIQYKVYLYSDGEVRTLEQVQGDSFGLVPSEREERELFYVTTVDAPCVDVFDLAGMDRPEDEDEEEQVKAEAIDWLVDEYESSGAEEALDWVVRTAEMDEY